MKTSAIDTVSFRRARGGDATELTALALRSKRHWNYDDEFMQRVAPSFVVSTDYICAWPVYLLEIDGRLAAFYGFRLIDGEPFLADMWVDPPYIGHGLGRRLWAHAIETAKAAGYQYFLIESDPNAEHFYLRMGARRIGERISPDSGRSLPLMRY